MKTLSILNDITDRKLKYVLTSCLDTNDFTNIVKTLMQRYLEEYNEDQSDIKGFLYTTKDVGQYKSLENKYNLNVVKFDKSKDLNNQLSLLDDMLNERYTLLLNKEVSNVDEYNKVIVDDDDEYLPTIYVIIDDFNDLNSKATVETLTHLVCISSAANFNFIINYTGKDLDKQSEDLYYNLLTHIEVDPDNNEIKLSFPTYND